MSTIDLRGFKGTIIVSVDQAGPLQGQFARARPCGEVTHDGITVCIVDPKPAPTESAHVAVDETGGEP